jgi:hypothetical protein
MVTQIQVHNVTKAEARAALRAVMDSLVSAVATVDMPDRAKLANAMQFIRKLEIENKLDNIEETD